VTLDDDVSRLAHTRPFSFLPREAVQLIAFSCEKRRLQADEPLFDSGEAADSAYFVYSGAILLAGGGADMSGVRRVQAGGLIGETALYAAIERRTGARAAEDAVVLKVPRETFRRVLAEFPGAAGKIRASVAERTHRLIDRLEAARIKSFDSAPHSEQGAR
jgi:CRP-like cAMP-binding protein